MPPLFHQCVFEDFLHVLDIDELQLVLYGLRQFFEISLVLFWQQDLLDAEFVGSQDFLLDAADREDFAGEGDFPGHSSIASDSSACIGRCHGGCHRDACGRAVFRYGAFWQVDVGVEGFIEIILESQVLGLASNVGVRGFSGFLHDIAHLACQDQVALALDGDGFGVEDFAACDRPCEAIDAAYGIRMFFSEREEFHWSQVLVECLDGKRRQLVVLEDDLLAYLAAEGADGSFKVTDACFSGVSCDDFLQERRSEADVSVLQAVSLFCLGTRYFFAISSFSSSV